jgi:hypothetical protein
MPSQFHSPTGTTSILDTEAFVTYADSNDLHDSEVMLTMLSSFHTPELPTSPIFITLELKIKDPKRFREYNAK